MDEKQWSLIEYFNKSRKTSETLRKELKPVFLEKNEFENRAESERKKNFC